MSQDFEKRTQEILEESVARLDGRTRSRLTQARHAALAQLEKKSARSWRSYVPAGAAAAAAVLAVMLYVRPGTVVDPRGTQNAATVEDMDILADAEAPDFTEDTDDVEFYEWAAGEMDS
jgi:negative regulator of sigma E activity